MSIASNKQESPNPGRSVDQQEWNFKKLGMQHFRDIRNEKIQKMIKKLRSNESNNNLLQTQSRSLLHKINSFQLIEQPQTIKKSSQNILQSQFLHSEGFNRMSNSNHNKRMKSISRLVELKKEQKVNAQFEYLKQKQKEEQLKKIIYSMIDEIQIAKRINSYKSRSHLTKGTQSSAGSPKNVSKRYDSTNQHHEPNLPQIQYISIPGPFKIIDQQDESKSFVFFDNKRMLLNNSSTNHAKDNSKKRSKSRVSDSFERIKLEKAYLNTIKELNLKKRFLLSKRNLYHTVDPYRAEKQFQKPQNSLKKISVLLTQKGTLNSNQKEIDQNKPTNLRVSGLVKESNSRKNIRNKGDTVLIKLQNKSLIPVVSKKHSIQSQKYKRKGKEYFHINTKKKDLRQSSSKRRKLEQILPQIKITSKKQPQK